MFGVLCGIVYGFLEGRVKNRRLLGLCYFLTIGAIWSLVTSVLGLGMSAEDLIKGNPVNPYFFVAAPAIGFILGILFALIPWIMELRRHKNEKTEP